MLEITSFFKVSYVWLSTVPIFLPTGQKGDGVPCILIIFSMAAGSTAWQIRYSEISESGTARVAPPVPDFTSMIPSFFKALKIFRMVTGLHPVDNDSSSLVTFFSVPYSKIKNQTMDRDRTFITDMHNFNPPFAILSYPISAVNIDTIS